MLIALLLGTTAAAPSAAPVAPSALVLQDWKAKVEDGKAKLLAGDARGALADFRAAHGDEGGVATELWVLRASAQAGDADAAFERLAEIDANGEADGAALDYAMGAARHFMAEARAGRREAGGMHQEAAVLIARAMKETPDAYPDGWLLLAKSARQSGNAATAAEAIDKALAAGKSAATLTLAAKIQTAQGAALVGEDSTKKEGQALLKKALDNVNAASEALGDEPAVAAAQCDVLMQGGVAALFLGDRDRASTMYARAIGWDPSQVDYGQLLGSLKGDDDTLFIETLKKGGERFEKRWKDSPSDAGMRWWLGYAQHFAGDYDGAIASFRSSITKFPNYTNCLWYIGLSEWQKGVENFPAAADAWEEYVQKNRAEFAQTVASLPQNSGYIGKAVQLLWKDGQPHLDNVQAARFAELLVASDPSKPEYWSSLGVMNRDAGFAVARQKPKDAPKSAEAYYIRAWEAYQKAAQLDRRPEYLNDGAVILHYYLERDYDKALALYDEAEALAEEWLNGGHDFEGEAPDAKSVVETALRDAKDNRKKLKKKMK